MASPDDLGVGLSQVAHAIRRSTALYVAMMITDKDSSTADLLSTADELALWLRGSAGEVYAQSQVKSAPIGQPWPPQDD